MQEQEQHSLSRWAGVACGTLGQHVGACSIVQWARGPQSAAAMQCIDIIGM
jgi:hypothetical protein